MKDWAQALQPSARGKGQPARGFTLIELMIVLVIIVVLALIAVPSFQRQAASSRVTSSTNELMSSLTRARLEAIKQGYRVTVCRSTNGTSCNTTSGVGWERGWIGFIDGTVTGSNAVISTGDTISFVVSAQADNIKIVGNGSGVNYYSFGPDGSSKTMPSDTTGIGNAALMICSTSTAVPDSARARFICTSKVGRSRLVAAPPSVTSACALPTVSPC
jgi:type IV fimbrial biogenesis protein FimT